MATTDGTELEGVGSLDFGALVHPLWAGDPTTRETDFIGSCFFVDRNRIVTCRHVLEPYETRSIIVGNPTGPHAEVDEIAMCESIDAATGVIAGPLQHQFPSALTCPAIVDDVTCFGWVADHGIPSAGAPATVVPRAFSGNVSMVRGPGDSQRYASRAELSFGVPAGMSGSPVLRRRYDGFNGEVTWSVLGMAHGNSEAEFPIHTVEEIDDDGHRFYERKSRIQELGLFHDARDLAAALQGLGVVVALEG